MSVGLAGVRLANPIVSASGCFGSGKEMSRFVDLSRLGAVVCKTVTLRPRPGIDPPRGAETPAGMLNAIGLQNPGVRSEEHTSELQSLTNLVCRLLLEKKKENTTYANTARTTTRASSETSSDS